MDKDRIVDRRRNKEKYSYPNKRKIDRRKRDKRDQNIYNAIMIIIPFVLIIWAMNLR